MYFNRLFLAIFWTINLTSAMSFTDIVSNELLQTGNAKTRKFKCETDRDCPEEMYCNEDVECVACLDCSKLNRRSRIRCARKEADCGGCLPQFLGETFVKSNSQWCFVMAERHKIDNPNDLFDTVHWFGLAVVFIVCMLGFASHYCFTKKRRMITINDVEQRRENFHLQLRLPPQPPPYKEDPEMEDDRSISCSFQIIEQVEERSKAIPYLYGDSIRNDNSGDAATPQNSNTAEPAAYINIHDETTVPSPWTPGASYGQSSNEPLSHNDRNETAPKKRKLVDNEDEPKAAKKKGRQ